MQTKAPHTDYRRGFQSHTVTPEGLSQSEMCGGGETMHRLDNGTRSHFRKNDRKADKKNK